MTSELYDRIVSERGTLENLIAKIPGFKGYHEKSARREADTMLRDFLAEKINSVITKFERVENDILGNGTGLMHMSKTREAKSKMQSYYDRVRTAAPKYSNMFASIKIGNDELDKIYAFDEAQLRYIEALETSVGVLHTTVSKNEEFADALEAVYNDAQTAIDAFELRDDVIVGLSEEK